MSETRHPTPLRDEHGKLEPCGNCDSTPAYRYDHTPHDPENGTWEVLCVECIEATIVDEREATYLFFAEHEQRS